MKFSRQRLLSWSVLLVLFLALVAAIVFRRLIADRPEPSYQDRPLTEWLGDLHNPGTSVIYSNAALAIQHLGTNAVPYLVDDLNARDSKLMVDFRNFLGHHGLSPFGRDADHRRWDALSGFGVLGPAARAAIPALAWQLTNQPVTVEDRAHSFAEALSDIGPDAVPALEAASTNGNRFARADAVGVLSEMGDANLVPILLGMCKSADETDRYQAVVLLSRLFDHATVVAPALIDALDDPDSRVISSAVRGLEQMGPAARPAWPKLQKLLFNGSDTDISPAVRTMAILDWAGTFVILTNALVSADTNRCRRAAFAFGELRPRGEGAVPALIKCLHHSDASIRCAAAMALGGIGKDPDVVVPALRAGLSDPDLNVSMANATALAEFGRRAAAAGPEILKLLGEYESDPSEKGQLFFVLSCVDPAAAANWERTNGAAGK